MEVLVSLVIASVAILALLRVSLMTSVHAEEQRLMSLAEIAIDDLYERLLLVPQRAAESGCDPSCLETYAAWGTQWRGIESRFTTDLQHESDDTTARIAWPLHPLLLSAADCEPGTSCLRVPLSP